MKQREENQSFKQKLENFWYYYKTPVILGILVLLIIAFLISGTTEKVATDLNISIVTADILTEGSINFDEALGDVIVDSNNDGEAHITINRLFLAENTGGENYEAYAQALEAQLSDRGAVLFIFDRLNYERMIKKDAFCPLNELIDINAYGDRVLYHNDRPMALSLQGSKVLADMNFTNDDVYAMFLFRRPEDAQNETLNIQYQNGVAVLTELMK
ncbi:MAG: hypothetical protein E7414_05080 [Ruminococcaceae bacterium]|nr:hypothetical protein [Oscillospiraceae bacterium]